MLEFTTKSTKETQEVAEKIAGMLQTGDVLALYGDLGSGKTTFTAYLVHSLGLEARVQSPTFVIARKYHGGKNEIEVVNHLDLYRLGSIEEVEDLGLEEMFTEKNAITIIEWPEIAEVLLPNSVKTLEFTYIDENIRKIKFMESENA